MSTSAADLSALRIRRDDQDPNRPRPWRRRLIWLCVIAVLALGGWLAWRSDLLPRSTPEVTVTRPRVLQAGGVEEVLTATGYLVPQTRAIVSARTSGRVDWLGVTEGSRVKAGEVIARLSSDDVVARVAEARASLAQENASLQQARASEFLADRELKRQEKLSAEGITSQADHDAARRGFDVAVATTRAAEESVHAAAARLKLWEAEHDKTIIRAPFDGIVIRKNSQVGEMVAAGAFSGQPTGGAIVTMADFSTLEMEADINEANLSRVKEGQPALVSADAVPDKRYRGVVRQIVPTADRQKAVVIAKVKILEPDDRLVPDMSAKVSFLSKEVAADEAAAPPRIYIPSGAIHVEGEATFVLAVREEKVVRLPVTLGETRGGLREATGGITGQEVLIMGGQEGLRAGDRVRIAS